MDLLFLVGLTGVGKSTVLPALLARSGRRLLPDRRQLTDRIILPAALRLEGSPVRPVSDRLERFRLTARYRKEHEGGIVHALVQYLGGDSSSGPCLFDGLRGEVEVAAAQRCFRNARFLMLEARPEIRIQRLLARSDEFDRQAGTEASAEPHCTERHQAERHQAERAQAERHRAERIVAEEQRHYDQAAARRLLECLPPSRRLLIDTDHISAGDVASLVEEWL